MDYSVGCIIYKFCTKHNFLYTTTRIRRKIGIIQKYIKKHGKYDVNYALEIALNPSFSRTSAMDISPVFTILPSSMIWMKAGLINSNNRR